MVGREERRDGEGQGSLKCEVMLPTTLVCLLFLFLGSPWQKWCCTVGGAGRRGERVSAAQVGLRCLRRLVAVCLAFEWLLLLAAASPT